VADLFLDTKPIFRQTFNFTMEAFTSTTNTFVTNSIIAKPTEKGTLQVLDYVIFAGFLIISTAVGIYFAIKEHLEKKNKTNEATSDYLMAGRSMSFGPVSLSLIASFMSSVTVLGVPAEYYIYGTMFTWYIIPYLLVPAIVTWLFMPVFYDLNINSTYEYLNRRFDQYSKFLAIFMYMVLSVLYGGVVVYGPSIALSEVTGVNEWIMILSTGIICIFYTSIGGLKAVIWTDVIQAITMLSGFFAVIIQGSINHGGFGNIWRAAEEGGRIDFDHFEFDPRIRHTFWSIVIGGTTLWVGVNGLNQAQVQRYVCCKSKTHARYAILLNGIGLVVILVLAGMTGLTIYATYRFCDPISSKEISKPDQLFPFIVMDILSYLPGVPGLFVAGVCSSSLSTISSGINAMACVTIEDFVKPRTHWSDKSYKICSQILVIGFGLLYIVFAYLASVVGGLIKMAYSILGMVGGCLVGLFTMGMMMPFINNQGAFLGTLIGFSIATWRFIGSQLYPLPQEFTGKLPLSVDQCVSPDPTVSLMNVSVTTISDTNLNSTFTIFTPSIETNRPAIAAFYDVSYIYTAPIGALVSILSGLLISCLTGFNRNRPKDELLCEFLRKKEATNCSKGDTGSAVARSESWMPSQTPLLTNNLNDSMTFQEITETENEAYNVSLTRPTNEQMEKESAF